MSCEHDCPKPPMFPRTIFNRPALSQIDYRIGTYAEMRGHMFDALNQAPALNGWTHRGPDDPGIALIESSAIVGDILTFYQSLYANEAFLRTAQWRESIAELVRLLGYRLAPGLGGEALFALAVKGSEPVTVPKGFGFKAQVESDPKPAEFESREGVIAYPHLSQFNLYRPYNTPYITNGSQNFYVFSLQGIPEGLTLKGGDRVLIGAPYPNATNPTRLDNAQVRIVEKAWEEFGRLYVKFKTGLSWSGTVFELAAYKLGESYRHFGHNASAKVVTVSSGISNTTNTSFTRSLHTTTTTDVEPDLDKKDVPLDAVVDRLSGGGYVLIEANISFYSTNLWNPLTAHRLFLVRKIVSVENRTLTWGLLSGSSTVLTLNSDLVTSLYGHDHKYADIRSFTFHEVLGQPFALRAQDQPSAAVSGTDLYYYGTDAEVQAMAGRALMLVKPDVPTTVASVLSVQTLNPAAAERKLFRRVTLDAEVTYADFDLAALKVSVYGNLVTATQGKTQTEVVIGGGDQRQVFQTFALPKVPLTYLLDETQTPAQVPELHVYVDGIEWQRVDTFFNSKPDDKVFIVREDEDNKSYVQFGDGQTASRLPSGIRNVTAVYRVGQGAYGALKPGTNPQVTGKLKDLDKVFLPAPATGGSAPESGNNARVAAPGKMQSLGRLVSLADFEAETLAIPNVIKTRAFWSAPEGTALVRVIVLTESSESADTAAVQASLTTFNRCRGPARFPIQVIQGISQFVHLNITAGFEATRRQQDIEVAIKEALGLAGEEGNGILGEDGLFSLKNRQFGEVVHKSQIIAAVQQVPGVTWVSLNAAQPINLGTPPENDPTALQIPTTNLVNNVLTCTEERLLALYSTHLVLSLSQDQTNGVCA